MDEIWDGTISEAEGCVSLGCGCLLTFGCIFIVALMWKICVVVWELLTGNQERGR